jgi:hypothetical protein
MRELHIDVGGEVQGISRLSIYERRGGGEPCGSPKRGGMRGWAWGSIAPLRTRRALGLTRSSAVEHLWCTMFAGTLMLVRSLQLRLQNKHYATQHVVHPKVCLREP